MASRHSVSTDDEEYDEPDYYDVDLEEDEEGDDEDDGETEESDSRESQVDWEARFKGLQGTVQRQAESMQQLQQQALMGQIVAKRAEIVSRGLPQEEAEQEFRQWALMTVADLQQRQNMSDREALESFSRSTYLQKLVNDYGIDTKSKTFERLSIIKDPEDMLAFVQEYAARTQDTKKKVGNVRRKAQGADRFEGGAGRVGRPPKKKAENLDDAVNIFAKYKVEFD